MPTTPIVPRRAVERRRVHGLLLGAGFFCGADLLGSGSVNSLLLSLRTSSGFGLGVAPGRLG